MIKLGKEHVAKNYSFEDFQNSWVNLMLSVHERHGSWKGRKIYQSWDCLEMK